MASGFASLQMVPNPASDPMLRLRGRRVGARDAACPPSSQVLWGGWGTLPHFPCPIFLPIGSPLLSVSPNVHSPFSPPPCSWCREGLGCSHQHGDPSGTPWVGGVGVKARAAPTGPPYVGVPSPCPGRLCRIRQQRRSQLSRGAGPFLRQEPPEEPFPRPGGSGSPPPSSLPSCSEGRKPAGSPPPLSSGQGAGHPTLAWSPAPSFGEAPAGNQGESRPAQHGHERDLPRAPPPPPAPQRRLEVRFGGSLASGPWGFGARWLWGLGDSG